MNLLSRFVIELIDAGVAMTMTLTIMLTFAWPFMEDGFWSEKLSYLWIATWVGAFWIFLPVNLGIIKAAYKDWRTCK